MSVLVVINQTVTDIPRFIKARIETTYRMQKHVSLGLSNRYRVDVFQGVKITKSNRMNYYQEKYDKAIFELYKSVEGNNPNTLKTDKRQSIFSSTKVLMLMVLVPLAILVSLYFVYQYFNQYLNPEKPKHAQSVNSVSQSSNPVASFSIRSSKVVLSSNFVRIAVFMW
ncbi:Zonular occludens toxin (Zot) [Arsenophonus nasoniae]|uniref:Zonular occludens toxin (Zot) n=2 Tax=Arsenophonus nasoniae TaxID=638 RepID=A0A4P7KT94_9GAMM|nr:zonular occludens toxin domain-containing protein [Arsenophonus nasoniae]QBY43357.1 Zonular occludens toxin (Zot) [Arsenophonus nasoniae]